MSSALRAGLAGLLLMVAACRSPVPQQATIDELTPWLTEEGLEAGSFTEIYASAVRHRLPEAMVQTVGPLELSVNVEGTDLICYLDNFWSEAREAPELRVESLKRFLDSLEESLATVGEDAAAFELTSIVPVIKGADFMATLEEGGLEVAGSPYAGDLWILYAVDGERGIRYLDWEEIDALKIGRGQVPELAASNLANRLPEIVRQGNPPLFRLVADGNYEASLLLFDELFDEPASLLPGELVAAVPSRDILLLTGSRSPEGLQRMRAAVEEAFDGPYSVSSQLLVLTEEGWTAWDESRPSAPTAP